MGAVKYATIANVPWGNSSEATYDVVIKSISSEHPGEVSEPFTDEKGNELAYVLFGHNSKRSTIECSLKASGPLDTGALRGSLITLGGEQGVVVSSSKSKPDKDWHTCTVELLQLSGGTVSTLG